MKKMNPWWIAGGVVLGLVVIISLWYVATYNSLIRLNEGVNGKWAQVETQYQRRVDLIPNIVQTVKGYKDFEQETLTQIVALRSQWQTAPTVNAKIEAANQIESTSIFAFTVAAVCHW